MKTRLVDGRAMVTGGRAALTHTVWLTTRVRETRWSWWLRAAAKGFADGEDDGIQWEWAGGARWRHALAVRKMERNQQPCTTLNDAAQVERVLVDERW
ncbi:VWA domain-containing protein [Sesbania bispinosa]|nr:VWA domain-containing protein [Sesbania bispinosa]